MRVKRSVRTMTDAYPVTAVAFADAGDQVYSGGLDNTIKVRGWGGRGMAWCAPRPLPLALPRMHACPFAQ